MAVGAARPEQALLAPDGQLARRWFVWLIASVVAFAALGAVVLAGITNPGAPRLWGTLGAAGFALSCAISSFACLALFLRVARRRFPVFDSLRTNAYGIYLLHYAAVAWLQFALLDAPIHAIVKATIVIVGATALAWAAAAALRRVPPIARVI